jgi:hypothetical protein
MEVGLKEGLRGLPPLGLLSRPALDLIRWERRVSLPRLLYTLLDTEGRTRAKPGVGGTATPGLLLRTALGQRLCGRGGRGKEEGQRQDREMEEDRRSLLVGSSPEFVGLREAPAPRITRPARCADAEFPWGALFPAASPRPHRQHTPAARSDCGNCGRFEALSADVSSTGAKASGGACRGAHPQILVRRLLVHGRNPFLSRGFLR